MVMRIVRWASMFAILAFMSGPTSSQPVPSQAEWINALHNGGFVIVFRHGATYQDQADTDPLNPKNIGKQRQLNDDGRRLGEIDRRVFEQTPCPCWTGPHQLVPAGNRHGRDDGFRRGQSVCRLYRRRTRGYTD